MKRPFAVIGFSMLIISLVANNINYKASVILTVGMAVLFCCLLCFKKLCKNKVIIFSVAGTVIYLISFIFAQTGYYNATVIAKEQKEFKGVVCTTPQESDYAFTYIIKVQGKNYKIRYVSQDNKMFNQGDIVSGSLSVQNENPNNDFIESSLAQKIYFTYFEDIESNNFLEKTSEVNHFYNNIGIVKAWFSEIIDKYIPSENGIIAKAMTIGDTRGISSRTLDGFNYSGTVHLLVISGLHLTLCSLGVMRFIGHFSKLRRYTVLIGIGCLFFYSAITGFSVSVLRAGLMVSIIIMGKIINRSADSINGIGVAIAIILLINPFSALSASFWFTILSTLSILILADKIMSWLESKAKYKQIMQSKLLSAIINNAVVSVVTTIFTLPVYIVMFNLIPTASVIANLVMLDLATLLMFLTFLGAFFHIINLNFISQGLFTVVGFISDLLKSFTDIIGFSSWSTMSVSNKLYKYFLIISLVLLVFAITYKKQKLLKSTSVLIAVSFLLLSVYCNFYDYNTTSIEVVHTSPTPYILINSNGKSTLVGMVKKKDIMEVKSQLNIHNKKHLDNVVVTENTDEMPSQLINLYREFNVEETVFCFSAPQVFESNSKSNVTELIINKNLILNLQNSEDYVEIFCKNKHILLIDSEKTENLFENVKEYDIIISYGKDALKISKSIKNQNVDAKVFVSSEDEFLSFNFE